MIPPLPTWVSKGTTKQNVLPTDARLRQKKRFNDMKEAGQQPKKRHIYTEPGNDDCGDEFSGLGKDIAFYSLDVQLYIEEDEDVFIIIPLSINDGITTIEKAIAYLCYG